MNSLFPLQHCSPFCSFKQDGDGSCTLWTPLFLIGKMPTRTFFRSLQWAGSQKDPLEFHRHLHFSLSWRLGHSPPSSSNGNVFFTWRRPEPGNVEFCFWFRPSLPLKTSLPREIRPDPLKSRPLLIRPTVCRGLSSFLLWIQPSFFFTRTPFSLPFEIPCSQIRFMLYLFPPSP